MSMAAAVAIARSDDHEKLKACIFLAVFGLIFSVVACVKGYYTDGGAEGVGRSTTLAVVGASLAILLTDFFLTRLLF